MPLDGGRWDWEPDPRDFGFEGVYCVIPQPGPHGGYSRPYRWTVEQVRRGRWFPVVSFICHGGSRHARIVGGGLLRASLT